ncbi:hypothetical protein H6G93_21785 [Nostoc sp. FACHB-973]|nr:hypothetical protein [Nostoc sp. FACHB-973]
MVVDESGSGKANERDGVPARQECDRINTFATVVGNLQPILAQVPTFIERAVMSADPEEEDVLT